MNLRDLEYLVSVADHLHFGKAALACHVSQPTLSMQIKKLEDYLGVTVFERTGKRVMLTPVGGAIVEQARQVLRGAKEIREVARHAQDPLAGNFRLGIFPTLAPYLLPRCVGPIHLALPKLRLFLVEEKTDELLRRLKKGELDAALLALPVLDTALASDALFEDVFHLAVPKEHALARKKSVSMSDMAHEPLLLLEEGHCLRAQALEVCELAGGREDSEFRATSLETLRHMVASGLGVTLIPEIAIQKDARVTYLPLKGRKFARTIGLVWRKGSSRERAISRLGEIIRKCVKAVL